MLILGNQIEKIAKDIPVSGSYEIDVKTNAFKRVTGPLGGLDGYTFSMLDEKGNQATKKVEVKVIDGGGRTLMPGLIESHVHLNLQHMSGGYSTMIERDW